ncbi:hypothetical protein NDU88_006406 [Pleurodeles waltl]|uniref:Uncharacterized protein n=1 Tax=Pleurodeles waltl TaxID=8319 RepID=A0AAV7TYE9_PLEWA|nr:hypothetical protein NDU88_006406 [Pleurodeles waltl]
MGEAHVRLMRCKQQSRPEAALVRLMQAAKLVQSCSGEVDVMQAAKQVQSRSGEVDAMRAEKKLRSRSGEVTMQAGKQDRSLWGCLGIQRVCLVLYFCCEVSWDCRRAMTRVQSVWLNPLSPPRRRGLWLRQTALDRPGPGWACPPVARGLGSAGVPKGTKSPEASGRNTARAPVHRQQPGERARFPHPTRVTRLTSGSTPKTFLGKRLRPPANPRRTLGKRPGTWVRLGEGPSPSPSPWLWLRRPKALPLKLGLKSSKASFPHHPIPPAPSAAKYHWKWAVGWRGRLGALEVSGTPSFCHPLPVASRSPPAIPATPATSAPAPTLRSPTWPRLPGHVQQPRSVEVHAEVHKSAQCPATANSRAGAWTGEPTDGLHTKPRALIHDRSSTQLNLSGTEGCERQPGKTPESLSIGITTPAFRRHRLAVPHLPAHRQRNPRRKSSNVAYNPQLQFH